MDNLLAEVQDGHLAISRDRIIDGMDTFKKMACVGCNRCMVNLSYLVQCDKCHAHICIQCRKLIRSGTFEYKKDNRPFTPKNIRCCPRCYQHFDLKNVKGEQIEMAEK